MATISGTANQNYSNLKKELFKKLEGEVLTVYADSQGIPTIF